MPALYRLPYSTASVPDNGGTSQDQGRVNCILMVTIYATAEITYIYIEGMPMWGPNRVWPGSGQVLRCPGPGFTPQARGPG